MSAPFSPSFIKKQRERLLRLRSELLAKIKSVENIQISVEDTREEGDLAQAIIGQNVSFELKERELQRLRLVDKALDKMDMGNYGICEETEEPIEKARLERMPWAYLSIQAAEERERSQRIRT